ncbi:acetolactate synthase small subunit [Sediminicola luteus]|jgi:acetolactate synthase-1/3 small subunit|uniref:Acetolactate synthase small subunit n=1 Tax=Sediminicola luteus TaxID=319238 RepID=A0A2A4G7R0_9FLAO|nr:acetolactate synthase small subunit [Sediminicola luteus]PCE64026.1 acetolactate synthase small subunit [Sediminicola luteus]
MEKKWFTISVYSENNVGLLNRISGIFLKRHINIESLNVSKSELEGISKFTIVIFSTEDWARKIVAQIEKQVEVLRAFYHLDSDIIYQESAIFKMDSDLLLDQDKIERIVYENNSHIVSVNRDFFVIAKTGRRSEIDAMYGELLPMGIMQFVRSGRIAVTRSKMEISHLLEEINN